MSFSIISDKPLTNPDDDKFDRKARALSIAESINRRKEFDPIVIGIYGSWGEGKTTFLNFIKAFINEDVTVIDFNPWYFDNVPDLIRNYFYTLSKNFPFSFRYFIKQDLPSLLSRYGNVLSDFEVNVSGQIAGVSPFRILTKISDLLYDNSLQALKTRISDELERLVKKGRRFVVIFDDIDRLDDEEIIAVFKLVKHTGDFPGFTYILSLDDKMVSAALDRKYMSETHETGHSFLEKIVQFPIRLPKASSYSLKIMLAKATDEVEKYVDLKIDEKQKRDFTYYFNEGLFPKVKTPRLVYRYSNAIMYSLLSLKNEVNPVDIMLIEGMRLFYRKPFEKIAEHPHFFGYNPFYSTYIINEEKEAHKVFIKETFESIEVEDKAGFEYLVTYLFPNIKPMIKPEVTSSQKYEDLVINQRVGALQYLEKYLCFAVSPDDVADSQIESLFDLARKAGPDEISKWLRNVVSEDNVGNFLTKLRIKIGELIPPGNKNLAIGISRDGSIFPETRVSPGFFGGTLFYEAADIVEVLISIEESYEKICELHEIIAYEAEPLPFAIYVSGSFWALDGGKIRDYEIREDDLYSVRMILVRRIRDESQEGPLFNIYPLYAATMFFIWSSYGSKGDVNNHISNALSMDPGQVTALLRSSATRFFSTGPAVDDLREDLYLRMERDMDTSMIYKYICVLKGGPVEPKNFPVHEDLPVDEKLILQFAFQYHKSRKKTQQE
jgi:hypothetical protein